MSRSIFITEPERRLHGMEHFHDRVLHSGARIQGEEEWKEEPLMLRVSSRILLPEAINFGDLDFVAHQKVAARLRR